MSICKDCNPRLDPSVYASMPREVGKVAGALTCPKHPINNGCQTSQCVENGGLFSSMYLDKENGGMGRLAGCRRRRRRRCQCSHTAGSRGTRKIDRAPQALRPQLSRHLQLCSLILAPGRELRLYRVLVSCAIPIIVCILSCLAS
jgi:hypothetical protein